MRPLFRTACCAIFCATLSAPLAWANGLPAGKPLAATVAGSVAHPISPAAKQWVEQAPGGFWLGNPQGKPTLTVFLDPNCSVCHRFYQELQPLIHDHQVAVRVLPVGVIQPTSLGKAAHIELPFVHSGEKPAGVLLAENESGSFQKGSESGHISPVSDPKAKALVQQHNALLERLTGLYAGFPLGRLETPVIVADVQGRESVIFGAPPQGAAALLGALSR